MNDNDDLYRLSGNGLLEQVTAGDGMTVTAELRDRLLNSISDVSVIQSCALQLLVDGPLNRAVIPGQIVNNRYVHQCDFK